MPSFKLVGSFRADFRAVKRALLALDLNRDLALTWCDDNGLSRQLGNHVTGATFYALGQAIAIDAVI